jgi:HAD superfamily hydrolase (TIGR01509 family)
MTSAPHRPVRGVVFDLDGVLVDSEHLWEESWQDHCRRHGHTWTSEDTAAVQGMSAPEWAGYIAERTGLPATAVQDDCVGYMVRALESGEIRLLDGARELIVSVAERVPVALASSAARRLIDVLLPTFGVDGYFTATVSSEEVPRGKPAPDVYAEATRRLGVEPRYGVAVEDSSNGIRSAHAAGLTVITIPNPQYPPKPDALALAAQIVASPVEARDRILAQIEEGAA